MEDIFIPAQDGYSLASTLFEPDDNATPKVVLISSATAVPRRFYQPLAEFLSKEGYTAVTYDYRGIGGSAPESLRGFPAKARDWALQDMAGVIDWLHKRLQPRRLFMIGHSYGGQTAGLLPNGDLLDGMATLSSQSGYWKLQGGSQKRSVAFHSNLTRRHISPADVGLQSIGHFGFFRPKAKVLWQEIIVWLEQAAARYTGH